jgi:hypothetical protein
LSPSDRAEHQLALGPARAVLDPKAFEAAHAAGVALPLEEAVAFALSEDSA